jgi:predicted metal-dependent hydrolase
MKTKWASLSPKGNLTVNIMMKDLPEHLIKYIILHEATHLIEKRHNESFWKLIAQKYKTYQAAENEIFVFWFLISQRSL